MADYKELKVWQISMDLVIATYNLLKKMPIDEKYGLIDQMRRAVVSVPSNIAEGQARGSKKEFRHFLNIANGSIAELETQLHICDRVGYLKQEELSPVFGLLDRTQKMIFRLLESLETHNA